MGELKTQILNEIISDLGDNYKSSDSAVLTTIMNDMITSALFVSNRRTETENNLRILKDNIKKATKTVYLRRGTEDVTINSESGLSNTYDSAIETMTKDIIKQNKRVLI